MLLRCPSSLSRFIAVSYASQYRIWALEANVSSDLAPQLEAERGRMYCIHPGYCYY